jgi:hypothetical protein
MKHIKLITIIIFVLVLSSLACNLGFGGQDTPEPLVPPVSEDVGEVAESSEEPLQDAESSEAITIEVSETQLTVLLTDELGNLVGDQITNLRVALRDGQIIIIGDLDSQGITAPVQVVIEVSVDLAGRPNLEVVSSSVGPFPVPGDLISEVESMMNKAFQEKIQSLAPNLHIEDIDIENGKMTIRGRAK